MFEKNIVRGAVFFAACLTAACTQSQPLVQNSASAKTLNARGSVSPSAPINLTYHVESGTAGQPQRIDVAINTRVSSGALLVEVAKQEGAAVIGETTRRFDLSSAAHPITLSLQSTQLGEGEHYLVLLLTIETEMGPMSRSFRIDLSATAGDSAL